MHFITPTPTSRIKNVTLLVIQFFKSLKLLDYVRMTNILKSVELYSTVATDLFFGLCLDWVLRGMLDWSLSLCDARVGGCLSLAPCLVGPGYFDSPCDVRRLGGGFSRLSSLVLAAGPGWGRGC